MLSPILNVGRKGLATLSVGAVLALGGFASDAQAATFDLRPGSDEETSFALTDGGASVTVSAFDATGGVATIDRNGYGWGAGSRPEGGRTSNGESIVFDFTGSALQSLTSISLRGFDRDETFNILVDGIVGYSGAYVGGKIVNVIDLTSTSLVGTVFSIVSTSVNGGGIEGFRISALGTTSVAARTPQIAAVPLPAGGVLLLSGLAALGLRRRKHG